MKGKWMIKGPSAPSDNLASKSYQELKQLAKEKGVPGYSRMSAAALRQAMGGE